MKTYQILVALSLLALAKTASAQEQFENIFASMLNDPKVQVQRTVQVDRNPLAGDSADGGYCQVSYFTIQRAGKRHKFAETGMKYVEGIENAMQDLAEDPRCYRIASYRAGTGTPRQWKLLYGDKAEQYVMLGESKARNYMLLCLLDPAHKGYRWCYAIDWQRQGSDITGRYMKFYARIPQEPSAQTLPKLKYTLSLDSVRALSEKDFYDLSHALDERANFLTSFAQLRELYYLYPDELLPVSIYTLCKDHGASLSADETRIIIGQLRALVRRAENGLETSGAKDYFELAIKVMQEHL